MLEQITVTKKTGTEPFVGARDITLADYWAWAHSDLVSNAERGRLAEFIVSNALGAEMTCRVEWDAYDVLTPEGIKVEVKASGYVQTWVQKDYSFPNFGIRPTIGSSDGGATFTGPRQRQADVYVFCLHVHKDQETINPLDLSQWEFYVLPTSTLNEKMADAKAISLAKLISLGAVKTDYAGLAEAVSKAGELK